MSRVKFPDEHNIRDRILTADEFQRMVNASPGYLNPILHCAYHTGIRPGEISELTWEHVDLKAGFIRLKDTDIKTDTARNISIGRELREVARHLPVALDPQGVRYPSVFTPNRQQREVHQTGIHVGASGCRHYAYNLS